MTRGLWSHEVLDLEVQALRAGVRRAAAIGFVLFAPALLPGQAPPPISIEARPGQSVVLSPPKPCTRVLASPKAGRIDIARLPDSTSFVVYQAPDTAATEVTFTIARGTSPAAGSDTCSAEQLQPYVITFDRTPEIPADTLGKAFRVLMATFVLALLLESAFTLLFNWRLFLEFFVGKAWRTPIMFAGALAIVRVLDQDLLVSLLDAYNPRAIGEPSPHGWFTSVLTAMILAGGSVGVNRILVALGFRSQLRPELEQPRPVNQEAFVSVLVTGKVTSTDVQVTVEDLGANAAVPPTFGVVRRKPIGGRLRGLFFPGELRIPASGGHRVDPDNAYRIVVVAKTPAGQTEFYDAFGKKLTKAADAEPLRFAPKAIVDFEVNVP